MAERAERDINGWYMTACMGRKWTRKSGGRSVKLEEGVWSDKLHRWLTPDEIDTVEITPEKGAE